MAKVRLAARTRGRGKIKCDTRGLAEGSIIVSGPFSVFWFRDSFRCENSLGCESARARSFEFRGLPSRLPSWDYWSDDEIVAHRQRASFVRLIVNHEDLAESQ